jgi:hypothetical protein
MWRFGRCPFRPELYRHLNARGIPVLCMGVRTVLPPVLVLDTLWHVSCSISSLLLDFMQRISEFIFATLVWGAIQNSHVFLLRFAPSPFYIWFEFLVLALCKLRRTCDNDIDK